MNNEEFKQRLDDRVVDLKARLDVVMNELNELFNSQNSEMAARNLLLDEQRDLRKEIKTLKKLIIDLR